MASDPEGIVDTLRELARLDPVELGLQDVLDQIIQAATTCCGITGGVGLLLLGPDDQPHYVAVAARRRSLATGTQIPESEGPSVEAFVQDEPVSSADLGAEGRWPAFRQLVIAAGIRAWLSVPVRQRHGPIGALDFAHTDPPAVAAPGPGHQQRLRPSDHGHPGTGFSPPTGGAHSRGWRPGSGGKVGRA
jgi:GAF domain-containing protein